MPFTLNGIGTHYYGAGNRSARVDVCKSCGKSATLSSYDTREWICVLFIPIVPLKKYRILNDCSRCRRHLRVSNADFARQLAQKTAPLRQAISRSPGDPQPSIDLIRTLIGWERRDEADRELQKAIALFPQNVALLLLGAELAAGRADFKAALPLQERAYGLEPQNPAVVYSYGWLLSKLEQHDRAVPVLQQAVSLDANKKGALYLLGASQMKLSRWNEALNSYQQLLALEPAYQRDKNLLRQIRDCKQRLGYQLTDAERRAGRRWWPFGRKSRPATLQPQPTLVRPGLRIAGLAVLALLLVGSGFYVWDRWTNTHVYFDNALDRGFKAELDGRSFDLPRNTLHEEDLRAGGHTVVLRQPGGKEFERLAFTIDKASIFDAVMHDRFFVYNVAAQDVYRRSVHGYAANREDASYNDELIAMQRFFEQRDVDYPFQNAPESIEVDSNTTGTVRKVAFNKATGVDLNRYAVIRLQQGHLDEARKAIDLAAAVKPCDTPTRRSQVFLAAMTSIDDATTAARRWMSDCAQDDLEAHRAYQDVFIENGREDELRAQYAASAANAPASARAHYLYGRVLGDPAAATAEYEEATRLDPNLIWPKVALGRQYLLAERYDDALREFHEAIGMQGCDPAVVIYYATTAIAKGSPADAVPRVEELRKSHPHDAGALEARWLLALASADWKSAAEIEKAEEPQENAQTAWWRRVKLMRMQGDAGIDSKIADAIKSRELHALAEQMRIERLIETGDFAASSAAVEKYAKDLDPTTAAMLTAYSAGGFLIRGNRAEGDRLLGEAEAMLAQAPKGRATRVARAVVDGLRGTMPVSAVEALARESDTPAHGWFVRAVRSAVAGDRSGESDSLAHCVRASSDLEFPYLEVKAMQAEVAPRPAG